jgi:N-methylhydantoinase A
MRYAGQAFELPVPGSIEPDPADLAERFAAAHEEHYGHRDHDGEVVLVHVRLALVAPGGRPELAAATTSLLGQGTRKVHFDGEWQRSSVLRGEPPAGFIATGPAIFELPEATFVLPPGWQAEVDDTGTIRAQTTTHPGATF